jgi:Holliday junction resolvasome RuvABC ATP-dependent DNA helicase subunit
MLGVDDLGLSDADRKYLDVVKNQYGGGPVEWKILRQVFLKTSEQSLKSMNRF